jgi:uncharacterized protein (DUF4415 family)
MSEREHDFREAQRGPVVPPQPGKTRITIRIDTDVLNWFRNQVHQAGGGSYQTLINEALREYIQYRDEMFERVLRKVIREELQGCDQYNAE